MIGDRYTNLLEELGKLLETTLAPDSKGCCSIRFANEITVQLEPRPGDKILAAAEVAILTEGRYRENVLREALRVNGLPPPQTGNFGYSPKKSALLFFEVLSLEELTAPTLAECLNSISQTAEQWKNSISRSELPSTTPSSAPHQSGMFGL